MVVFSLVVIYLFAIPSGAKDSSKKFILDVDMVADTDDLWAIRAAEKLDKTGEEELIAVMMSASGGEGALSSFLTYDGYSHIPVGVCNIDFSEESPYWEYLENIGFGINEKEDAVKLYRKLLSEAEGRVSIVTTGYLINIAELLKSGPDEYSELTGEDLVREKVRAIHITGGSIADHWENNLSFCSEAVSSAKYVFSNWPDSIPVVIYTNDLGAPITIGENVSESDPIYNAQLLARGEGGSPSWDVFTLWAFSCMDHNKLRNNHLSLIHCSIEINDDGTHVIEDKEDSSWWRITKTVTENNWYKQQLNLLLESG